MSDANAEQRNRREGSIAEVVKRENRRRKRLLQLIMALFTATIAIGILLLVYGRSDAEVIDQEVTRKVAPVQESYNQIKPTLDQIQNIRTILNEVSQVQQDFNQQMEALKNVSARLDNQDQQLTHLNESQKKLADEIPAVKTRLQEIEPVTTQVSPLISSLQDVRSHMEQQETQLASIQQRQEMYKNVTTAGPLGTLLAGILLILILGLVVQSIQIVIEKLFGLKTRALINSLENIFNIITLGLGRADDAPAQHISKLVNEVIHILEETGRANLFGKPRLDSLTKRDLHMALKRIEAEHLLPGTVDSFQEVLDAVRNLKAELRHIDVDLLEGDASAKIAALRNSLMPLAHDFRALTKDGQLIPHVLLGDLYQLRQINVPETLNILGQLQREVDDSLATADKAVVETQSVLADVQKTGDVGLIANAETRANAASLCVDGLADVYAHLKRIAEQITAFGKAFDRAFAPVCNVLQQVEIWYDTIMKGFEERYSRQMKAVSLIVSLIITVGLNLNIFSLYSSNLTFTPVGEAISRGLKGNGFYTLRMILAWIITAALLSTVASFWHVASASLPRTRVNTQKTVWS